MQTIKISELPIVNNNNNSDLIPLSQNGVTKKTTVNSIKDFILDGFKLDDSRIVDIENKIPSQASAANQLADKDFVNSSISNLAANYVTPDAAGEQQWASLNALRNGPWYHRGILYTPTQNDYAIFINTDSSVWRAAFNSQLWSPTYKVNDSPFTASQLAALNSQITAALVQKLNNPNTAPAQNSAELITSGGVFAWFGAALNTLKTTAKTVVNAINELFDSINKNRIYSSVETNTGKTWINGSPIYRRAWKGILGAKNYEDALATDLMPPTDFKIISMTGFVNDNNWNSGFSINCYNPAYDEIVYIYRTHNNIIFSWKSTRNLTGWNITCIIEYIKEPL